MASTTDNFNLDLYDTGDPAALTDQYNSAMHTIDNTLLTINTNATTANQNANNALEQANTNKQDIATNKEDITSIKANINALGINTVNDATNVKNMIRNTGGDAIWIGDSIIEAANQTTKARTLINNAFGYTEHYYAVGGSGWINQTPAGNNGFNSQINRAIADASYDHDNCRAVFVIGGVNDFPNGETEGQTLEANVVTGISSLVNEFRNAIIYVGAYIGGALNAPYSISAPNKYNNVYRRIEQGVSRVNHPHVKFFKCYTWGGINPNAYESDGLHFNNFGQQLFFNYLRSIILGLTPDVTNSINYDNFTLASAANTNKELWVNSICNGELYYIGIQFDYIVREQDIQNEGHTLNVPNCVSLPPWIHTYNGYYKPIPFLSNAMSNYTIGDATGYAYMIANNDNTNNPLHYDLYFNNQNVTFNIGDNFRINFKHILPAVGIVTN